MRNLSDGTGNWGKILYNFDVVNLIQISILSKAICKFRLKWDFFFFDLMLQAHLTSFRFPHNFNPRLGNVLFKPSSCLYVKKLWWRIYSAVLRVFTLNRPWFSFIISWIKSKCLVNFSTFFTNTCWWYSIFYVRFFIAHLSSSQNNNKNV